MDADIQFSAVFRLDSAAIYIKIRKNMFRVLLDVLLLFGDWNSANARKLWSVVATWIGLIVMRQESAYQVTTFLIDKSLLSRKTCFSFASVGYIISLVYLVEV